MTDASQRRRVLLLGPSRSAVSGVSTHLNQLFYSDLQTTFDLRHFQVGAEGRREAVLGKALRLMVSPFTLAGTLLRNRPDIVHINSSLEPKAYWRDVAYLAVSRVLRRKVVWQVHGGALPSEFLRGPVGSRWLRWTLNSADSIVVLARAEMDDYRHFVSPERLTLIPNAIAMPVSSGDPPAGLRTEDGSMHLVFVGRLARDKGIFEVLEALRLIDRQRFPVRLTVAGSGECASELAEFTRRAGLEECVSFKGAVFGEQKDQLWRSADLFLFPTYHREGLPYALLEAMAAGVVPVVSPIGAIPDVVTEGVHGVFVAPRTPAALAETIERLFGDREAIAKMSVAGQQRIKDMYSVARLAREFAQLYRGL